jgi:hypothetical protein
LSLLASLLSVALGLLLLLLLAASLLLLLRCHPLIGLQSKLRVWGELRVRAIETPGWNWT